MRKFIYPALLILLLSTPAFAGHVNGYYKSNGTYVQGYERSNPNSTVKDNYSYKGNYNPYTGTQGDDYYRNSPSSDYYGTTGSYGYGSFGSKKYGK